MDSRFVKQSLKNTFPTRMRLILLLALLVFMSALATVYVKDQYRNRFIQLEKIKNQQEALQTEWSQLLLEESTFAAHARILNMAKDNLHMHQPTDVQIRLLKVAS